MQVTTIAIGGDHAGFPYKAAIIDFLQSRKIEVLDMGPCSAESVDYPDFAHLVGESIQSGKAQLGILLCGSGNGVAMTANKHQKVRAGLAWSEKIAELTRQHNDANALAIPVRFVSQHLAVDMVKAFLDAEFEGGRHARRVNKIATT